jgi:hypothetical protein
MLIASGHSVLSRQPHEKALPHAEETATFQRSVRSEVKMPGRAILLTVLIAYTFLLAQPAFARKSRIDPRPPIDPTCPVDANGRPDASCSRPTPELTKVSCPKSLSEDDCDLYRQGFDAALEDHKIFSETERGNRKDDRGDTPAYKAGYEAGWKRQK